MKNKIFLLLLLNFLVTTFSLNLYSYHWPMKNAQGNFNGPLPVSSVLGDYRGSYDRPRFHRGIDIPVTGNVYSIISGTAFTPIDKDYVRVGDFWYMHLRDRIRNGRPVEGILDNPTNPTRIGIVADDHLHFQIGNTNGPYLNPLTYTFTYNNQNYGPRPYNYTDPDNEHGRPIVHQVDLFREYIDVSDTPTNRPERQASAQLTSPIWGLVEIRGRCQDRQYSANSAETSGIYRTQWRITDTTTITATTNINDITLYGPFDTIIFPQVQPPNNDDPDRRIHDVRYVYDVRNSRHANSRYFYYWVTNPIINNQVQDRYWNTKLRSGQQWNGLNARVNEEAQTKDGRVRVWVCAYDIMGNGGDMVNRRGAEYTEVVIDNFRPYVKRVTITQDNEEKYNAYWDWDATRGLLLLKRDTQEPLRVGNATFRIEFSEPVRNPTASLAGENIPLTVVKNTDGRVWKGTLDIPGDGSLDGCSVYFW